MVDVGVDLHRKRSHVVALDPAGAVVPSRRIGDAPVEFLRIFGELEPQPIEVAFEATDGWSWFADLLADAGIAAHVAHPLATKATSAARVKNDAVDAKTLAHLLRTNLLAEAWTAPPAAREARRLVRTRAGLVRMRSRVPSQLRVLLAGLGVIPELTTLFGPAGRRWRADLPMPASARGRLDAGLRLIDAVTVEVGRADAGLRSAFAGGDRTRRLLPIPGGRAGDRGHRGRWGLGRPAVPRTGAAVLLGRADPWGAHQRRPHPPRPYHQAGIALAALDAGRGGHHRRPRPAAGPLRRPGRPAPWSQGRPGGVGPAAAHPVLRRPARPGWLPWLPRPLGVVAGGVVRARSVGVMALGCNGRRLD
jgi:Transposase